MTDLNSLTVNELAPLLEAKQLSPVELTESLLSRIDDIDPAVNAFITPLHKSALNQARIAEDEIMKGRYKGFLHGIPIGIKDNFYTKGIKTTGGSKLLLDFIPNENATVVEKLIDAGSIILGKLNMHEFGGGLTNTNPFFGNSRNPWDLNYMTGGSSGGSGGALGAGLIPLATGTDTFGSIRVPASMCGVYGLKPTYGLVSTYGILPLSWTLDHAGPMARSVEDLALMLNVIAGYDSKQPGSIKSPKIDYRNSLNQSVNGLKIGIPTYFLKELDQEVLLLFHHALKKLQSMGAEVEEIDIPELTMAPYAGYVIMTGEAATSQSKWLTTQGNDYAQDVRSLFKTGFLTTALQYVRAQQVRRLLTQAFSKTFEKIDIIVGPVVPHATQRFHTNFVNQNLDIIKRCMPFTSPANLTGTPSLSVPIGFDSHGLPAGMQFIANHLSEDILIKLGNAWERQDNL
ncbi:amidase [Geomicrobium sediminis]|uniref:Aspartyl-tRNA(Asn)/glutamyl-tRNA(Gln) amidotransferase subunit A n=1 Tax=Geomicrobium sediminis TaxID=1347788 RepID=A0ABS2PGR8_9BACL|nr:amidase [Geomicrobium sediminis]EZH64343.1 glutamyl-tRNA amidotransferase [Bacillaceae bacterium JMAK1]MBM7634225.1 aspartyl-tRNA(Asn)/glutamyl-tRNA(Gln) amidotransferase subunit A [Geomicrobium sediminis]